MAREHGTSALPWGTLEELLLACAVNRHGTANWDSVAMEVQARTSAFASALLTARHCRDKFHDLAKRFVSKNDGQSCGVVRMVDELRRLRVEELRREVRRSDVSIVSLELKVKRLEEESDRSLKAEVAEARPNKDRRSGGEDRPRALPESLAGTSTSGEASDERENRSFNESNSTSQKENRKGGNTAGASRLSESNEWESAKRGGVVSKQNDDVQSSASLSKRSRHGGGAGGGGEEGGGSRSRSRSRSSRRSRSGEEGEGDEVSPATSKGGVKQLKLMIKREPLIKVLRIIRSHRLGSVFERRLRSQESERYKSLIREHTDLHAIQTRLSKGVYTDCTHKFFRDLLLLFNNAVVFFRKTSPEHVAAQELRSIVLKEMHDQLPKPQPVINTVKSKVPKVESDGSVKPRKSSIVGCGRRAGSVNALSEGSAKNRRGDRKERREVDEEAKENEKKMDGTGFVKVEDNGVRKRRTQERAGRRRGGSRTSSSRNVGIMKHEYGANELSSHDGLEIEKLEKKENVKKRQGAARFLKRMKQNSSSTEVKKGNSDSSEDDSEDSMLEEDEKKKKKTSNRGRKKPDTERKERVTRSSSGRGGGRRDRDSSGRGKRGVGRPPKRPEPAGARSGKRGRGNGEADQVGSGGRPRKRTRR